MPANFCPRLSAGIPLFCIVFFTACNSAPAPKLEPSPAPKAASPLNLNAGPRPSPPSGCEWVMNQTEMPGDEYLLYLAAKCKDGTATLHFAGGAHSAELRFDEKDEHPAVVMFTAEPGEGEKAVLRHARYAMNKPAEAAKCSVYPAKDSAADGFVVDISPVEAAKIEKARAEPRTACGPYGIDQDSNTFWRVFQGYAWYFNLGQEQMTIDPGSLTLATKDAQGKWTKVVPEKLN